MSSSEILNLEVMNKDTSSSTLPLMQSTNIEPIQYFKCCNKQRILPKMSELGGLIMTILLILIPSVCFFFIVFFIGNEYKTYSMSHFITNIVGFVITFITLITTYYFLWDVSTASPGYQESPKMSIEQFKQEALTKTIRNVLFPLKYCETCQIVRDIRTFHCKICKMCIEKQDHHCGFVANCIGKKNVLKFISFQIGVVVHCIFLGSFSGFNLYSIVVTYKNVINLNWMFPFVILDVMCVMFIIVLSSMSGQLLIMISKNQTTNEQLRKKYDNSVFNDGCKLNWKEAFLHNKL